MVSRDIYFFLDSGVCSRVYTCIVKIGELSREANVSVDTVRYYERRGLIPLAPRTGAGYRTYSADDVRRLKFIVHAKELGFTLDEIRELLSIRSDNSDCESVKALAEAKAREIDVRMKKMSHMKRVLLDLAGKCGQKGNLDPCPILKTLEEED